MVTCKKRFNGKRGFHSNEKENYVQIDVKSYGSRQKPRLWYKKSESVMEQQSYKTTSNNCVFVQKFSGDDLIILFLYVDDTLITGKNGFGTDKLKKQLGKPLP